VPRRAIVPQRMNIATQTPKVKPRPWRPETVTKLMGFIGATAGSAVGWWAGAHVGVMTAFILSVVGTAVGVYGGKQLADRLGY